MKITLSLKIHEKIVKIDKKQNPLKSYCKTVPLSYTARTRSVLVAMLYIKVFIESRGAAGRGRCIINLCRSTCVQLIMNPHISQRRSPPQNSLHSGSVFLLRHLRNLEKVWTTHSLCGTKGSNSVSPSKASKTSIPELDKKRHGKYT